PERHADHPSRGLLREMQPGSGVGGGTTVKSDVPVTFEADDLEADDLEATARSGFTEERTTCQFNNAVSLSSEELKRNEFALRVAGGRKSRLDLLHKNSSSPVKKKRRIW